MIRRIWQALTGTPVNINITAGRNACNNQITVKNLYGTDTEAGDVETPSSQKILHPEVSEVAGFTGRESDLEAIHAALFGKTPQDTNAAALTDAGSELTALQGLGGVGKSVLAKQYAWLNRDRFAGIWWLRAENAETLDTDLIALGARFIGGIDSETNRERAVQTVFTELIRLSTLDDSLRWLLIYDNVEQPSDLVRRLPQRGGKVLITSRWTDWYPQAVELPVDTFSPEQSIEYLLARARKETEDSAADLGRELGYLPLALDHARSYCWQSRCSFSSYQSRADSLIDQAPVNAAYPASVYATFSLAIERAIEQCPEADDIMCALSLLSADAIPIDLVAELCESKDQSEAMLSALTTVSLLTDAPLDDGTPAVNQHRLVQAVARGRMKDDLDTAPPSLQHDLIREGAFRPSPNPYKPNSVVNQLDIR